MSKIAVIILADSETHGDLGRAVNALLTVKEVNRGKPALVGDKCDPLAIWRPGR